MRGMPGALCKMAATLVLAAMPVCLAPAVHAAQTRTWTVTADDLPLGKAEGMAWTGRGRLFLAPQMIALGGSQTPQGPAQVWAMARDEADHTYLGTGPEGQILRILRSAEPELYFVVREPMVTALAVGPDGELYAGTAPRGVIYRIEPDGTGEPWAATEERYVWALVFGADGMLYAGTGERGRILRIGPDGETREWFDTREPHVVSLEAQADGVLLAGGAGRGLVYRIDGEGHALVLHDDDLSEVVALAHDARGDLFAALVAPMELPSRRPALRLRLPDGVQVGRTDEALGTLEESSGPTLRGTIEGLPAKTADEAERVRGRVVRIEPGGAVHELWSSTRESPFCLARDPRGRILFGTGEPARLYRVEPDGDVALLTTLREAQLTRLLNAGDSVVLSTSNPAAAYRLHDFPGESGSYESRPFDAGGLARWGTIGWRVEGGSAGASGTELYTRTGNSREPDETWSAWSPALTDPADGAIVNPDGRFLQWRVRQIFDPQSNTRVDSVSVRYEPYNRAPRIEEFRVEPRTETESGAERVFGFKANDPDGDTLAVTLEYRPLGADAWATAAETTTQASADRTTTAEARPGRLVWNTVDLMEGEYEVRGVATDTPANPPGEGFASVARPLLRLVVDRTPPEIVPLASGDGVLRVRVTDALSAIRVVELREGDRARFTARAEDGVCDSRSETFRIELGDTGQEGWSLRGIDAAGNLLDLPLPVDRTSH